MNEETTQAKEGYKPLLLLPEREYKLLEMCLRYNQDPFGAPNHLLMVLVAKLAERLILGEDVVITNENQAGQSLHAVWEQDGGQ